MKPLKMVISILFIMSFSSVFADGPVTSTVTVQNASPAAASNYVKVTQRQCLLSQICEPNKKTLEIYDYENHKFLAKTQYFGVLSYMLLNDVSYIFSDGKVVTAKEVGVQNEVQQNMKDDEQSARSLCQSRMIQIDNFYTPCEPGKRGSIEKRGNKAK
jgi:hypothetical protein